MIKATIQCEYCGNSVKVKCDKIENIDRKIISEDFVVTIIRYLDVVQNESFVQYGDNAPWNVKPEQVELRLCGDCRQKLTGVVRTAKVQANKMIEDFLRNNKIVRDFMEQRNLDA